MGFMCKVHFSTTSGKKLGRTDKMIEFARVPVKGDIIDVCVKPTGCFHVVRHVLLVDLNSNSEFVAIVSTNLHGTLEH